MFTMMLSPLSGITPPSENLWAYLGETNIFNVGVVLVLFVILYKTQGWNIGKSLDSKIQHTVGDLQDAEMLKAAVVLQQEELQTRLKHVEYERQERLLKATERGQAYAREVQENTQRKFRQLRDKHDDQKLAETDRIQKVILTDIAVTLITQAKQTLQEKVTDETAESLLWEAFDEIANAYERQLRTPQSMTGTV